MSETTSWLVAYLDLALERRWCTRIYCTTCGAQDFRAGLHRALERALGQPPLRLSARDRIRAGYSPADAEALARALAALAPDPLKARAWTAPLHMVLHELDASAGPEFMRQVIEPLLAGSWAGDMLGRMQRHEMELAAERRERAAYESKDAAEARRAEKKRLKAEAHAKRLAAKEERDREWRARQT